MQNQYDAIVIGAGMSGLAAGIRLAMFDKKVCILEKHRIPGGLNSYYQRRNETKGGIRKFDVGLHALTNYVPRGAKNKPLTKLLKQLRLNYDDLKLCPQTHSLIHFPEVQLKFSNNFEELRQEVEIKFKDHYQEFLSLVDYINNFNELDLGLEYRSAKGVLREMISSELLVEMIICPLLIYGSAWEDDMDFAQFVIMFKSLYYEGFARPEGGVRTILDLLVKKFEELGGELRYRQGVEKILVESNKVVGVKTEKGEELRTSKILSSMGYPETVDVLSDQSLFEKKPAIGPMTFMETIIVFDKKIPLEQNDSTIIFYNNSEKYHYTKAENFFDDRSAVVCFPDNYEPEKREGEGIVRITFMAKYEDFKALERLDYKAKKEEAFEASYKLFQKLVPGFDGKILFKDVFSPTTIERYTWHKRGTIYGSTDKTRDGRTPIEGLYIIGTDQGFLGIVGAILSGISMANLHGLMES